MRWRWLVLSAFIFSAYLVGFLGYLFTVGGGVWYEGLIKPRFTPPDWVFSLVWPILYTLMAVAAYFVWSRGGWRSLMTRRALVMYGFQLILNFGWPMIFFGWHSIGLAAIELLILLVLVVYVTSLFFKISRWAGYLMIPYLVWVGFALILNGVIWRLN